MTSVALHSWAAGQEKLPDSLPKIEKKEDGPVTIEVAPLSTPAATPSTSTTEGTPCCDSGFDWKKVPPVRVFPRPGNFPILPSGPGYYSFLDVLRDEYREKPPRFPYPPFGLIQFSFFDADFRYLDDPKNTQHDTFDPLKRIHVGDNFLLSTGGDARFRYMNEDNTRLTNRDNIYGLYRVRTYADMWYRDVARVYIEGIFADSVWHDVTPLGIDGDRADFQNLFVDLKLPIGGEGSNYVRVGRQELLFGSQRLISPPDWANTRRTFQGVRAFHASEKFDIDLFWVQPVVPNNRELNSVDNNVNFGGAWATYRPKPGTFRDFYYLFLDNTSSSTQQGIVRSPVNVHTFGSRFAGDVEAEWLYDVELALQLGRRGTSDIIAGMATVGGGYHFKDRPLNPTIWAYYDYASGDSNPNNGNFTTFNQLFPFGHYYLGWADLVGRQNIHDLNFHLYLYPAKWITVWTQYHNFWLDQRRDALYGISGAAVRRDPTGAAGTRLGQEIDFVLNFHLGPHSDILTGYSKFWGGSFLEGTASATRAVDSDLFYVQYSFRW